MKGFSFLIVAFLFLFLACQEANSRSENVPSIKKVQQDSVKLDAWVNHKYSWKNDIDPNYATINVITTPEGFTRIKLDSLSFGSWLRYLPLKENSTVYLFNGQKKLNQNAQFKVIDVDVGTRDLQQCADAVMRLRAEYLYANREFEKIHFNYSNGVTISFKKWSQGLYPKLANNKVSWVNSANNDSSYKSFKKYLQNVFTYAGSSSLSKELVEVPLEKIKSGDVFIKGGFPGHAVIVIDVCENANGDKAFMLAQSYMPAQDVHILSNPKTKQPWYFLSDIEDIVVTPEWTFEGSQLKRFVNE